jgi:hypothetical protein
MRSGQGMTNLISIDTNSMIATLRAISHEIDRVNARLNQPDLDDDLTEELALYINDLACALSAMSDAYEHRRKNDNDGDRLMGIENLLAYFSGETAV